MLEPVCDEYVQIVFRLGGGNIAQQAAIWEALEEDVRLQMYLRYVDRLNRDWAELTSG